jgi:regulator of sigma E protease
MFLIFIIAFISLIGLSVLHEFGHFILAKLFGVKVEEFGVGYPPKLFGKRIGETLYSLNLLPFGAFVRLFGETETGKEIERFSKQPVGKRALIAFGGVLSFWLIAAIIFSLVFNLGASVVIEDTANSNLADSKVQIADINPNSPAQIAGLKVGDTIKQFQISNFKFQISKVKDIQELTEEHKGQEVTLTIEREKEVFEVKLVPRVSPPAGEGPMGLALVRTAIKKYSWYQAIWQGTMATGNMTLAIIDGYSQAIKKAVQGLPSGVQLMGPIGIFHLFTQASQLGINYFLQFIGMIAIYLALFNVLPIPAVDGGKILFLGIEAVRKKPVSEKIEQNITTVFFTILIILSIWVAIKDISRIF